MPVRHVGAAVAHPRDRFGFDARHETDDFAVLVRNDAEVHLWGATDEGWSGREDLVRRPICSGAEAGTVVATDFGTREFATLDLDGNLLTFLRRA